MAALEMSKELDGLFNKLKQGAELITPSEQDLFAAAVKTRRTQALLKEALENFNDRKSEDIEWEALHCRTFRQEILDVVNSLSPPFTGDDTENPDSRSKNHAKLSCSILFSETYVSGL